MTTKINNFLIIDDTNKNLSIAIVDDFTNKSIFLDFDRKPDISHGKAVERFIEEGLPDAEITRFDTKVSKGDRGENAIKFFGNINNQLDELLKDIDEGKHFDAVNFSNSSDITFSLLSTQLGKKITPENISSHKKEIKSWIRTVKSDGSGTLLSEIIQKLDKISSQGVSIYIGAGNLGSSIFNLFTLADNCNSVGMLDEKHNKHSKSGNNSIVNKWEQGVFDKNYITEENGKKGVDFTGDGSVDIESKNTTSYFKWAFFDLWGTSFSTPKAIVSDFK